jgi:hypothetical protein
MVVLKIEDREEGFNEYLNHKGELIRIDPTKAHNLLALKEASMGTNGDLVFVYDGEEGSGKSTEARQDAAFLDRSLNESRIEFTPDNAVKCHFRGLPEKWNPEDYMKGTYESKPWESIILDESAKLDRKKTMSSSSVEFTGFMTQSRQLHKIFFIVLPSIHMLDGYIAEHRCVALIHCFKNEKQTMGFYKWYSRRHIKTMFTTELHKRRQYAPKPSFQGRFSKKDPFDLTNYERKKAAALEAYRKAEGLTPLSNEDEIKLIEDYQNKICKNCIDLNIPDTDVYKALGVSKSTWFNRKKKLRASLNLPPASHGGRPRKDLILSLHEPSDIYSSEPI